MNSYWLWVQILEPDEADLFREIWRDMWQEMKMRKA